MVCATANYLTYALATERSWTQNSPGREILKFNHFLPVALDREFHALCTDTNGLHFLVHAV